MQSVPILAYHYFGRDRAMQAGIKPHDSAYITPVESFRAHCRWLFDQGYTAVSFDRLATTPSTDSTLPDKPVVITIDDGHRSVVDYALPVLREFGWPGEVFVIVDWIGSDGYLSWHELRELASRGIQPQSHGLSHRLLNRLDPQTIVKELFDSREALQKNLGAPVPAFAVPMGGYPGVVPEIADKAGYRFVCTSFYGISRPNAQPLRLPRIVIRAPYDGPNALASLLTPTSWRGIEMRLRNIGKQIRHAFVRPVEAVDTN